MRAGRCLSARARGERQILRRLAALVFLGVLFSFPAAAAEKARGFDLNRIPDLPPVPVISDENFAARTILHEEIPMDDPALAFQVRLPKGWVKAADFGQGSANLSHGILGEVARYYSPPDLDLRNIFTVQTVQLGERMSLRNWVVSQALSQGHTLEGLKELAPDHVESQYVTIEGDINYRVRTSAWTMGPRILVALYKMPYRQWSEDKAIQARCISSFLPLAKPPVPDNDGLYTHSLHDVMQFVYPLSWRLRTYELRDEGRMKATLINGREGQESKGWVNILIVRRFEGLNLQQEVDALDALTQKAGLAPGPLIESVEGWAFSPDTTFSRVDVRGALPENGRPGNYEVWRAVLVVDGYLALVSMATPARDELFNLWAFNLAAFRRVVETLQPYKGGQDTAAKAVFERRQQEEALQSQPSASPWAGGTSRSGQGRINFRKRDQ